MLLAAERIMHEPIEVGKDLAIILDNGDVAVSSSTPGKWYTVSHDTCDCRGYEFRRTCRHLRVARAAQRQVALSARCPLCDRATKPSTVERLGSCVVCSLNGIRAS